MKTIILTFLFIASLFPQGMYTPNSSSFSAGILYGSYGAPSNGMLGFSAFYSYKGIAEISYARSTVLTEEDIDNFHNKYLLRGYLSNGKRLFVSGGIGYQDYFVEAELWKNFPIRFSHDGFLIEGGLHLSSIDDTNKRIVVSLLFNLSEAMERIQVLNSVFTETKMVVGMTFEAALIYYLSSFAFVISPKLILDNDFEYHFVGFNFNLMLIH